MKVRELEKIMIKEGWYPTTQNGSHLKFKHNEKPNAVIVPVHNGDVPIGTLKAIFKQAGIEYKEGR